jgi:hypothetical protein
MMKSVAGLLGAAALALVTTVASAAEDTNSAGHVLPDCRDAITFENVANPARMQSAGACMGFVRGVSFMGLLVSASLRTFPIPENDWRRQWLCIAEPAGVTNVQRVQVVVAYIEAQPARMHEDFQLLALEALRTSWPCR